MKGTALDGHRSGRAANRTRRRSEPGAVASGEVMGSARERWTIAPASARCAAAVSCADARSNAPPAGPVRVPSAELAKLEAEHAKLGDKVTEQRRQLPWVAVEKEYRFDTEDGRKTLAELFDGRSQLLAYNIMFGPDYELGACPGCTSLADGLDGAL